jgi:hypothetical protein
LLGEANPLYTEVRIVAADIERLIVRARAS